MGNQNINKKKEFISRIHKDLSDNELHQFYRKHNIVFEYVDLFRDFALSLTYIIHSTYLGDEITPPKKQISHFNWCWKKNLKNFEKENIYFESKGSHYRYFIKYFIGTFYTSEDKELEIQLINQYWKTIISYIPPKKMIDVGVFLTFYNYMEKNLVI